MAPDPLDPTPESPQPSASGPGLDSPPERSPLKRQAIQILRTTIHALESVVDRLEIDPPPGTSTPPFTEQIQAKVGPPVAQTLSQVRAGWRIVLGKIRAVLPRSLNQRMSDWGLTGAIGATLLLIVLSVPIIFFPPPPPTIIAVTPSPSPGPSPLSSPGPAPSPRPFLAPLPQPSPSAELSAPEATGSPALSGPSASDPPASPPPVPPLKLSPEQKLIASIQDQVAEVSNQYLDGLIQSVQANFRSSLLRVNLGNGWYELGAQRQDTLANEILSRAQDLDFSKLELVDAVGDRLARSPVVGAEMIILQRTRKL
jgi:hypothetical protein